MRGNNTLANLVYLFICNSAAGPDVSGPVMIKADLLKPIKGTAPQ